MKHKYNIKIDPPVPTDAQIGSHKDFGRILADYHNLTQPIYRVPLYKNPKAFLGLVLILTIAGLVFWQVEKEEKDEREQKELAALPAEVRLAAENSFLKAPFPALQVPTVTLDIDNTKPQKLALADGTVLNLPADAFGFPDGMMAKGQIHLQVRQVSSIAALIAMGLPLQSDGQLISPTQVLEINATADQVEGPSSVVLGNAKITIEVPVAANALQARQIYTLDPVARTWRSAAAAPVNPHPRKQNRTSIQHNDGFGVVEYDDQGKVIPTPKPASDSAMATVHVLQFDLAQLGTVCLGEAQGKPSGSAPYKVRFTDADGQALRLLTLYGLAKGRNSVEFLWPKSADFAFDIDIAPSVTQSYVGFLPDGRLATIQNVAAMPETQDVHVLQMRVSAAPIKDIQELTQLIDGLTGL
jgi:hypothetical protein